MQLMLASAAVLSSFAPALRLDVSDFSRCLNCRTATASACASVLQPLAAQRSTMHGRIRVVQMNDAIDVVANSAGTVLSGYLAGASAGPALSAMAATSIGLKNGSRSWKELGTTVGFAVGFSILAAVLAATSLNLGVTALSRAGSPLVQVPLLILMVGIVAALVPMTALLTGTFFSPAVPFMDQDEVEEYKEMQDTYRSDQWKPPQLWTRPAGSEDD